MAKHKNEHREICQIYLQYKSDLEIPQRRANKSYDRSPPEHRSMLPVRTLCSLWFEGFNRRFLTKLTITKRQDDHREIFQLYLHQSITS